MEGTEMSSVEIDIRPPEQIPLALGLTGFPMATTSSETTLVILF